jgi:hypothetical protein
MFGPGEAPTARIVSEIRGVMCTRHNVQQLAMTRCDLFWRRRVEKILHRSSISRIVASVSSPVAEEGFREIDTVRTDTNNPCKQTVFCPRSVVGVGPQWRRCRRHYADAICTPPWRAPSRARLVLDLEVKSHFACSCCVSLRR